MLLRSCVRSVPYLMENFRLVELGIQGLNQPVRQDRKLFSAKQRAHILPTHQVTLTTVRLLYKLKVV